MHVCGMKHVWRKNIRGGYSLNATQKAVSHNPNAGLGSLKVYFVNLKTMTESYRNIIIISEI